MEHWNAYPVAAMRMEAHFGDRLVRCFAERPRSMHAMLEDAVRRHGADDALVFEGRRWAWNELDAEVARVADITERTVYRHYATRDDLVRAFIKWHLDQMVGGPDVVPPDTIDALLDWVGRRYEAWSDDRIVIEAYLSPLGRELRRPLHALGLANNKRLIQREIPGLSEEESGNLAAVMLTLISTENFVFLRQNLGWDAERITRCTIDAIRNMLDGARLRLKASPGG